MNGFTGFNIYFQVKFWDSIFLQKNESESGYDAGQRKF